MFLQIPWKKTSATVCVGSKEIELHNKKFKNLLNRFARIELRKILQSFKFFKKKVEVDRIYDGIYFDLIDHLFFYLEYHI